MTKPFAGVRILDFTHVFAGPFGSYQLALTAAYDGKIQAMSGIMSVPGHPETGPTRASFAVCDCHRRHDRSFCRVESAVPAYAHEKVSWSMSPCSMRRSPSSPRS